MAWTLRLAFINVELVANDEKVVMATEKTALASHEKNGLPRGDKSGSPLLSPWHALYVTPIYQGKRPVPTDRAVQPDRASPVG